MALSSEEIIVDIPKLGSLRGSETTSAWTGRKIYQFLGVKYAEAPIGSLRFKKPIPIAPWTGIKDATKYGKTFPNPSNYKDIPEEEKFSPDWEDCISLCVYSTNLSASHPVMVYIHGGGFYEGGSPFHPPNYLLEKNVVLVVPQYRLGALGFLSTMTDTIPGNAGIFDVILSLEWVQKYIKHFGGDPNNVTAFGQSSGSGIVSHLIISPLVPDNLFHRVIIQSGSSFGTWATHVDPVTDAKNIAITSGKCSESSTIQDIEHCLLEMDVKTLLQCTKDTRIRPVVGGPSGFLNKSPNDFFLKSQCRKGLSVMTGVTKHDGGHPLTSFYDRFKELKGFTDTNFNSFKLMQFVVGKYGSVDETGILTGFLTANLFDPNTLAQGDFNKMITGLYDFVSTVVFKAPVLKIAQYCASVNPQKTWLYTFDYEGEHTRFGYGADTSKYPFRGGVAHSDDNIYLFPWPDSVAKLNKEDTKIARKMVELWTSFATNGIPSCSDGPLWPPMETPIGPYLHIDRTLSVGRNFHDEFTVISREGQCCKENKSSL